MFLEKKNSVVLAFSLQCVHMRSLGGYRFMCVYTQESISQKLEKGRERKKGKKPM